MDVNNLSSVVTQPHPDRELNPRPLDHKSDAKLLLMLRRTQRNPRCCLRQLTPSLFTPGLKRTLSQMHPSVYILLPRTDST